MKSFHDFQTTIAIKNEAVILIQTSDKIYNVMEGLDILTYFPPELETSDLFIDFLSRFFEEEYPNYERFNLTRHLQLLPGLCNFAKEVSITGAQKEKWNNLRNEILFLIYGTQNPNGSWGYFPQHFSPDFVLNSPLKKEWRSLDPSSKNRLSAKCTSMRDYYVNSRRVDESKATNSIVWTAYCLITLMDAFEDTQESEMAITRGVSFLLANQNKSGGWGFNKGSEANMSATCIVLVALFRAFRLQLSDIHKDQLKRGVRFINNKIIKSTSLVDTDRGGGGDLQENSNFTFSIPSNVISCYSTGIIEGFPIFEDDINFTAETSHILNNQIDNLIHKDNSITKIWEHRVILQALNKLYLLYINEIELAQLDHLYGKLENFIIMRVVSDHAIKKGHTFIFSTQKQKESIWAKILDIPSTLLVLIGLVLQFTGINTRIQFLYGIAVLFLINVIARVVIHYSESRGKRIIGSIYKEKK